MENGSKRRKNVGGSGFFSSDLTGDYLPGSSSYYLAAQGDLYNGTGYIWLMPSSDSRIMRIKVENRQLAGIDSWPHSLAISNETDLRPLPDGRLYISFSCVCCFL